MVLYKSVQFQKEEFFLFSLRSVVIENYAKLELCEAMRKHSKAMSDIMQYMQYMNTWQIQ